MPSLPHRFTKAAGLLTLCLGMLLLGCGASGGSSSDKDTTPPTVTITDNVTSATATGPITFTFTFSEAIDTFFDPTQITITNGTAGAFNRASDTVSTLVVTPLASHTGTLTLTLAAGAFRDLAGNGSAAVVSTTKAYDTTIPTLTITDNVAATTATGPVTFTFTFSEGVDASFDATKIAVSGGVAGAFTRSSATVSTLVVNPAANTTGTINVSVAAGAFKDLAGNASTASASASQGYNTTSVLIPTVVITDNVAAASASGPVTFTFTFSEAIDTTFNASKITVTGGTAGTFTRSSTTVSTLVVTPPANQSGTITVSVAAGAFKNLTGTANTAGASANQAYNTAQTIPTVVITDNVPAATATASVTFTFTFSEAIDTTFTASKITVTGGTAGTFTRVSSTVSTLVVTPPANQSGTLTVAVGVGAFKNLAGTANTVAASANQNYLTGTPVLPYKDPSLAPEARVADLLARMTLDEKLGQMVQTERAAAGGTEITTYFLGSVLSGGGSAPGTNTPAGWAAMVDGFQQQAMNTRLAIPMIYGIDAVHGHNNAYGAVLFPHNIGLGAANDPDLMTRLGQLTADEMKATGIRWTFAPCVAVPQNERWGRTYEGFGEIPELSSSLGAAYITGLQGSQIDANSVIACAKHYMADGGTDGGGNAGNATITEALLRAIHLPPYQAAVKAGVGTVMSTFSAWNGVPMRDDKYLLTNVLRGELGFDGFVVSDWNDVSADIANGINSGVDMAMMSGDHAGFINALRDLVNNGTLPLTRIDEAVSRILLVKFRMGLFEHPYSDTSFRTNFGTAAHRATAREAVAKSVVLLKNQAATLPISTSVHNILVTGSKADNLGIQCGGWSISWGGGTGAITIGTTLREAITTAANSKGMTVTYSTDGTLPAGSPTPDLVIVALGEYPYVEGGGDSGTLTLPDDDAPVFTAAQAIGKPLVTVMFSGRPLLITNYLNQSSAFLAAWLPGTEGDGLADVLFGTVKPTGTLPHTWPASFGQVPINKGDGQVGLFNLGYGLTYP